MISTVIPVYKNTKQFLDLFQHNYPFIKDTEIIIVDDASGEGLKEQVEAKYKNVTVLENEKNLGFAISVNKGIAIAKGQYILLLNSDVKLLDNHFEKSLDEFKDAKLFAQSYLQREKNGSKVGKNVIFFKRGLFFHSKAPNLKKGENGWAEGGSCMIKKSYFSQLKGFNFIYKPFYWEDIDLSYRASKKGWYVLFNSDVEVEHHHESTIGKYYDSHTIKLVAFKNQFLFTWQNASMSQFILHIFWLPFNMVYYVLKGEPLFISGLVKAFITYFHE